MSAALAAAPVRASTPAPRLCVGARVRVSAPLVNYGLAKFKGGLPAQGLEGTVVADVSRYRGKVLSASYPWKVSLEVRDASGKPVKAIMHLASDEMEVVSSDCPSVLPATPQLFA